MMEYPAGQAPAAVVDGLLHRPPGWDKVWRAALAASAKGQALAVWVLYGDSISRGYNSVTRAGTWWRRINDVLQQRYGDGGSGFHSAEETTTYAVAPANTWADSGVTTGVWSNYNLGYGGSEIATTAVGATVTWNNCVRGRRLKVHWCRFTVGGNIDIQVSQDGGAWVTIAAALSQAGASALIATLFDMTVVAPGIDWRRNYSVKIISNLAGGALIDGVTGYNDAGVLGLNFAKTGSTVSLINQIGWSGGPAGSGFGWQTLGANQCDLFINAMGVNDRGATNYDGPNIANNWTNLWLAGIWYGRYARMQADPLRLPSALGVTPALSADVDTGTASKWIDQARKIESLCRSYGFAYINHLARLQANDQQHMAGIGVVTATDKVHPADGAGHVWMAQPIIDLIA